MGLLGSRWEASWEGHQIAVVRNEWTKGFQLECDGEELSNQKWSAAGIGKLEGEITHGGETVTVRAVIDLRCEIYVDDTALTVETIK